MERLDERMAIIARRVPGSHVLRLTNEFTLVPQGTAYVSRMETGSHSLLGRSGLNHLIRRRILPSRGLAITSRRSATWKTSCQASGKLTGDSDAQTHRWSATSRRRPPLPSPPMSEKIR